MAVLESWDGEGEKKLMRLLSHPQHNLLKSEGGCEAMAEGESIMAPLYPTGPRFTWPASSSSSSLCEISWRGGCCGGLGVLEVVQPATTPNALYPLTDTHS